MSPGFPVSITLPSEDATRRLAEELAPLLSVGDVILLEGDIGAGKTFFARALIQTRLAEAGRIEDVPSPTYTLVQTYDDGQSEIWHADLYRLTGPQEAVELGLGDAFESAICLIEWPDRLGDFAPRDAAHFSFAVEETDQRRLTISADPARWAKLLDVLKATADD